VSMDEEYVWVVETGAYESCAVEGVYASIEAAIAANPVPENYRFRSEPSAYDMSVPTGWVKYDEDRWGNGMDWDYAATATRMKVQGRSS
jgi:hypothetical protein